ncbi:MAG: dockerin type I domain-containing protein [Phycisphaerales bacterium]
MPRFINMRACLRALSTTVALTVASSAACDDSLAGPFAVSQRSVTVTRANGSTFTAQVRYPATGTAAGAPFASGAAPAPALSFGHGFLSSVDLYDSTMDHLASHGYIVIATTSEGGLFPSHSNFALDIRQCLTYLAEQDGIATSWLSGAVDEQAFAVGGHSMGGGASALAAAADARIKCMVTLAAAETNPSSTAAAGSIQVPSCFIVGSQDAIVAPATTQNQFNACDAPRVFATITGGSHCGFIDSPIIACDSGSIPRAEQLAKTRALMLGFLQTHLRGDAARFASVWGAGPSVAGTTASRDPRMTAGFSTSTVEVPFDAVIPITVSVTNTGPDATAFRLRNASPGAGGFALEFTPAESPMLAAGATAELTAWVQPLKAGTFDGAIDVVRMRDGAGASQAIGVTVAGGPASPADLNGDGTVDAADLATLLNAWGKCNGCAADFNGNGSVDAADLAELLNAWN